MMDRADLSKVTVLSSSNFVQKTSPLGVQTECVLLISALAYQKLAARKTCLSGANSTVFA